MIFLMLLVIPIVGVLWFINLTLFLRKLHADRGVKNETVLGAALTFILIFFLMYVWAGML